MQDRKAFPLLCRVWFEGQGAPVFAQYQPQKKKIKLGENSARRRQKKPFAVLE